MTLAAQFPSQGAGEAGRSAASLVDVFRARAQADAARVAFTFLGDEDYPAQDITYAALDARARAIAGHLQQVARPGERALLMYDAGLEYIAALAGCLYAGVVAVPAYPPDPMRANRTLPRLEAIIRDANATLLLGTSSDLAWAGAMLDQLPGLDSLVATNQIDAAAADAFRPVPLDRQTLAFLQYTSGSTGDPKGVMIRHGHALANLSQMEATVDVDDAVVCMWLPTYHDMGLIGGVLQCWYSGRRNIMLSPLSFFQRPLRWLRAMADYRATTTGAPDFAYELCVRKTTPDEREALDLNAWRIALSGAEPVRPATIDRFVAAFAPAGVRSDIFCPTFGMAEATLMVACSQALQGPIIRAFDGEALSEDNAVAVHGDAAGARLLAACGRPVAEERLAIVDPSTRVELSEGRVGEIWVAGPNVAAGYWNRPEESSATFAARLATNEGPFLRTGDAGFLHDGELYISGRLKDSIIVHGRNYFPQDIEQTVEAAHEALKSYGGAAFSVDLDGRERVVIVHEVSRPKRFDLDDVSRIVRWAVLEAHDVLVDAVVLIKQGTIPKTTSGKIQRRACREQFLHGDLQTVHEWNAPPRGGSDCTAEAYVAPRTPTERLLAETWADVFGLERVGANDNFFALGGHSLLATQLMNRLAPRMCVELPLSELFARPTVRELAALIDARRDVELAAEEELLAMLEGMPESQAQAQLAMPVDFSTTPSEADPSTR